NISLNLLCLRDVRARMSLHLGVQMYLRLLLPTAATILALLSVRTVLKSSVPEIVLVLAGVSAGYMVFALCAFFFSLESQDKMLASSFYLRIRSMFIA